MSKLGFHVSAGNRRGFGDCLTRCRQAGNPIVCVFSVDQDLWPDIISRSPSTVYVYRTQRDLNNQSIGDGPADMYQGDAKLSAARWMALIMPVWARNKAHYYAPVNEQDPSTLEHFAWHNTFTLECMRIADANGYRLGIYAFSAGNPKDVPNPAIGSPFTKYDAWRQLIESMQYAKAHGHILLLHEYGFDSPATANAPHTTLQSSAPNLALRYREVYRFLNQFNACPRLIVSEASAGTGYRAAISKGGITRDQWISDVQWYDREISRDAIVIGCCLYQAGGAEDLSEMFGRLGNYISATHTPPPEGDPVVASSLPPIESVDGMTVPPASKIVDSGSHTWTFGAPVPMGHIIVRDGIQFAGGQGNLLLYYNKKVYAHNANNEWYVADGSWTRVQSDPRTPILQDGIDVSLYQNRIDWAAVKPTVSYAFIKATQGADIVDPWFVTNWASAKAQGIPRGAYHFYKFYDAPVMQANLFLNTLRADYGELPLVVDVEDSSYPADADNLKIFIDFVEAHTNRRVMIYTSSGFWNPQRWGKMIPWAKDRDLWIASYTTSPMIPSDWGTIYRFWQFGQAAVPGINGAVDKNRFNGDAGAFQAYLANLPKPPAPPSPMKSGVGVGTMYPFTTQELDAMQIAKVDTVLLMTVPDYTQMRQAVQAVRNKLGASIDIVGRLFFPEDGAPYTPPQALAYCLNGLRGLYDEGVREYQIGNEPNVYPGGLGWSWQNGAQFGAWLTTMLSLLRVQFPGCHWGYPALSPQPNTEQFFLDSKTAADQCDWVGVHSYFYSWSGGQYNAVDETGGMKWKSVARLTSKPLYLTEYSCNTAAVSYAAKGAMYKNYIALLRVDGRISKAHCFALSWGYQDASLEAWVIGNGRNQITDIPRNMV